MKKGFTLIELLAVIVILAIIALIATPIILGVVENARKSAAGSSALGYLDAVEKAIALDGLDNIVYPTGDIDILTSERYKDIEVQGEAPSKGTLVVSDRYLITSATLCVNNYKVELTGHKIKSITKDGCDSIGNENATPAECFEYVAVEGKDNEIKITKYKKGDNCPNDVVVPSIIDGKKVTMICGNKEFDEVFGGITSVVLPNTLKSIGPFAFLGNKLTEVIIPEGVTEIGAGAFATNHLASVTVPASVTKIGPVAFYNNQLTNVIIKRKRSYSYFDDDTRRVWYKESAYAPDGTGIWGWAEGCDDSCITWEY